MKFIILFTAIALIIISHEKVFAQKKDSTNNNPDHKLVFTPGVSFQRQFFGEVNLMYGTILDGGPCSGGGVAGPRIGVESNFNSNHLIIAPKVGYELAGLIFCFRGSAVCYLSNNQVDLRLLPEIGVGLFGLVNLTYGFGIPLLKDHVEGISKSRVTLTVNICRELWENF